MRAFIHRPQSLFLRRALFQVHLWVGVVAALYVFLVCVTGAVLVFRLEIQRAAHPHLFTPDGGPAADASTVMDSVRDAFPDGRLSGVDAPTTTRPTWLAYVLRDDRFLTLLVDPSTAAVLGELPERSAVRTLQDLHFDLLAGRTGRIVNGAGGLCLLVMALTGLAIWWPGAARWRRSLVVDFSRNWRRTSWDLHSAVGIWAAAFAAMWAVTGVYFAFPSQFRAAVNGITPVSAARTPTSRAEEGDATPIPWHVLLDTARARAAGLHVARIVVPSGTRDAFLAMFSDVSPRPAGTPRLRAVYLDQFTGEVLLDQAQPGPSTGDVIMAWLAPLHVGNFAGTGVRVLWFVFGLAPPLLAATGIVMWWTRAVRPRLRSRYRPAG